MSNVSIWKFECANNLKPENFKEKSQHLKKKCLFDVFKMTILNMFLYLYKSQVHPTQAHQELFKLKLYP